MPPLIDRDSLAGEVVVAAVLFPIAAELAATYAGRLRDESGGRLRLLGGSLREVLFLRRPGDVGGDADRRSKRLVVAAVWTGLIAAFVLVKNEWVPIRGRRCFSASRSRASGRSCGVGRS
jgi:hypothetical protein